MRRWVVVILACVTLGGIAPGGEVLPSDPAVLTGRLENGVRYAVARVEGLEGRVYVRLRIDAGAMMERDDARSAAHLAQRLALKSAEDSPEGQALATRGVRAWRDYAGAVGPEFSVVTMVLASDAETVGLGLGFLARVADAETPEESASEDVRRGLINELRAIESPASAARETLVRRVAPGSALDRRIPLSTSEFVERLSLDKASDFLQAWYRPSATTVVAVGDIEPEAVEGLVRSAFASLAMTAAPEAPLKEDLAYPRRAVISLQEGLVRATTGLVALHEPPPPIRSAEDVRREVGFEIAALVINLRLHEAALEEGSPLDEVGAWWGELGAGIWSAQVGAHGDPARWDESISALAGAVRSASRAAWVEPVLEDARLMFDAENRRTSGRSRDPGEVLESIDQALRRGDVIVDPGVLAQIRTQAAGALSAGEVSACVAIMFPEDSLAVLVESPPVEPAVTSEAVLSAATQPADEWAGESKPRQRPERLVRERATEAEIVELREDPQTGVVSATLANGIVVHHRRVEGEGRVIVRVRLGGGEAQETRTNRGITRVAGGAWIWPATRTHDAATLHVWSAARGLLTDVDTDGDALSFEVVADGSSWAEALELSAAMTGEPVLTPRAFERRRGQAARDLEEDELNPRAALRRAVRRATVPVSLASRQPAEARVVASLEHAEVSAWVDRLARFSAVDVAIVGDVEREAALVRAAEVFGPLPTRPPMLPREPVSLAVSEGWERIRTDGPAGAGTAGLVVALSAPGADLHDAAVLDVAAGVLDARLASKFAGGGVVASIGASHQPDEADPSLGLFTIGAACAPEDAERVVEGVRAALEQLAGEGPSEEEVARVASGLRARAEAEARDAGRWAEHLANHRARGTPIGALDERARALGRVTSAQVREAMAQRVRAGGWIVLMPPA